MGVVFALSREPYSLSRPAWMGIVSLAPFWYPTMWARVVGTPPVERAIDPSNKAVALPEDNRMKRHSCQSPIAILLARQTEMFSRRRYGEGSASMQPQADVPSAAKRRSFNRGHNNPSSLAPAAFTLVEMLVVITIIGILAALIVPAVQRARIAARNAVISMELGQFDMALKSYKEKFGEYPPDFTDKTPTGAVARHLAGHFHATRGIGKSTFQMQRVSLSPN